MEICKYNKIRLNISEYVETTHKGNITCPCCETPVIAKRGEFKQHHFAHKSLIECDSWYQMSEWHSEWQKQFKEEFREVVCVSNGEKHRADIKINHLIIEFQNSNISNKDYCQRNDFYTANGDLLVWVFNLDNGHAFSTLNTYNPNNKILCFTESQGLITNPLGRKYTKEEFIELLRYFYKQKNFNSVYNEIGRLEKKEEFLKYKRDRYSYESGKYTYSYETGKYKEYNREEIIQMCDTSWIIKEELKHKEALKTDSEYKKKWYIEQEYQNYKTFRLQKDNEEKERNKKDLENAENIINFQKDNLRHQQEVLKFHINKVYNK